MNKVKEEFSIHSQDYGRYNIIQQIVAKALIRELSCEPKRILELGCGSGQIFRNITFNPDYYKAIDFSSQMCNLHPKADNLDICCYDFDSIEFYDSLKNEKYDLILSSSALQWSKDLDKLLEFLSKLSPKMECALFTSNTFKTIFEITNKTSPILKKEFISDVFSKYFEATFETYQYKLEFDLKKDLFDYIKKKWSRWWK